MPQPRSNISTAVSLKMLHFFQVSAKTLFFLSLWSAVRFFLSTVAVVVEWGIVLEFLTRVLFSRSWCTISVDRSWWQKFKYLAIEHFSAITICIWHPFFLASPFAFLAIFYTLSLLVFATHPGWTWQQQYRCKHKNVLSQVAFIGFKIHKKQSWDQFLWRPSNTVSNVITTVVI